MRVYFDNAATTPLCQTSKDAMSHVIEHVYGNPSSIHAEGRSAKTIIEKARKVVAQTLNCSIGEIFFTSGGTESNNMVLVGAVRDLGIERIISSHVEHHCVLHSLDYIGTQKTCEIVYLDIDKSGTPSISQLEELLTNSDKKTLVSLMHVNNELGTVTDINTFAKVCEKYGALFHSDTTQSVGLLDLDTQAIPIHFLSGSAHKFHGPKGVGFVFIQNGQSIQPLIHGGSQERNMRAGTENIIGIAGLATALENTFQNREKTLSEMDKLRSYFIKKIKEKFPNAYINGSSSSYFPKILSVSFPPSDKNEMLLMSLDIHGISASGGSACSSGVEHSSGVLDYIGEPEDRKTVRFSFYKHNTSEEVDFTISKLQEILA